MQMPRTRSARGSFLVLVFSSVFFDKPFDVAGHGAAFFFSTLVDQLFQFRLNPDVQSCCFCPVRHSFSTS
nr:MAG TPA_asm: hypothetical protein [Caudoviricetes sp.]